MGSFCFSSVLTAVAGAVFVMLLVVSAVMPLAVSAVVVKPDLIITKTHEGTATANGTFKWKLRVQNIGEGTATFGKNDKILKDEMPSDGVNAYGSFSVFTSGVTVIGSINCTQDSTKNRDLKCRVSNNDGNSVVMPPDSFFDVFVDVYPTAVGTLNNPRPTKDCEIDYDTEVTESNEGNNTCSDSVTVAEATAQVHGFKYFDAEPHGPYDPDSGDYSLENWTLCLSGDGNNPDYPISPSSCQNTDANGSVEWTVPVGSSYVGLWMQESGQDGWTQTFPDPQILGGYNIDIWPNGEVVHRYYDGESRVVDVARFGNWQEPQERGRIIVRKVTNPQSAEDSFNFSVTGNDGFSLSNGGEYATDVAEGTYTISEDVPDGWVLSDISCEYDGSVGEFAPPSGKTITVDAGDTVTCTFTNTKLGKIIIEKVAEPEQDEDGQEFDFETNYAGEITLNDENDYTHESEWLADEEYSISEQVPSGWDLTSAVCSDESDPEEIELSPGEIITCAFTNTQRGSVQLEKIANPNEGLFTFSLNGPSIPNPLSWIGSGSGSWSDLIAGSYDLTEILPEGWAGIQSASCGDTSVNGGSIQFTLDPGATIQCLFNNTQYGMITGKKWNDKNANGTKDRKDGGVKNWPIELWQQAQGEIGDPDFDLLRTVTTGQGGNYSFTNLEPGLYRVCEGTRNKWQQTYPTEGMQCENGTIGYQLDVRAGEIKPDISFGNYTKGSISGKKFEDVDGNGSKNDSEPWLSGWTIYLDLNNSGTLDEEEPSVETDRNGKYKFTDLEPGTYTIREIMKDGWAQTKPAGESRSYVVVIESRKNAKKKDFGNMKASTVIGYKWDDLDGDGVWDHGEPALGGWTIALGRVMPDQNLEDNIIPIEIIELSLTGSDGKYVLPVKESGTYKVFEEQRGDWSAVNPPRIDSFFDITYRIDLGSQPSLVRDSFFDIFVELQSGQEITTDTNERLLQFGNFKHGTITGRKWDDLDGDGMWDENEHGKEGWQIALGRVMPREEGAQTIPIEIIELSLTGSDGAYSLRAPLPGEYKVFEASREGWTPTHPAPRIDSFFDITYRTVEQPSLVQSSFFDIFIEVSGQNISTVGEGNPIDFGNHLNQVNNPESPIPPTESSNPLPPQDDGGNGIPFTPGGSVGGGQVLGASVDDQIEAIRLQIIQLQQRLIETLRGRIAEILRAILAELQARLAQLIAQQP